MRILTKKISIKIAIIIGLVEILAMALLYVAVNESLTKILGIQAIDDMNIISKDRAHIIETYIENCCNYVDGYSKTPVVREILENKNDQQTIKRLTELTNKYASGHIFIEGLYVAEWDTTVLSHINPSFINKTFRAPASAKALEEKIRGQGKAFCLGVVTSPVTGKMVIPVFAPVFNEKNEAIGFAGASFHTEVLGEKLNQITDNISGYSLIDAESMTYIFNANQNLVGKTCENIQILDVILNIRGPKDAYQTLTYKTNDKFIACYYIAERDWVFIIEDSNENVFRILNSVKRTLFAACILITIIMVLICAASVDFQTIPLHSLTSQIQRLKSNDYTHYKKLDAYCERDDEFGTIANAVKELHYVLENQYHLFSELLEAQTVGTLVTNAEDNEIILINKMAIQLYGLDPTKKNSLTMEDIKNRFNDEEREKIAKVRELAKKSKEEIIYETYAIHEDGKKVYFFSHAKSATLSNGDNVIIFSFIDITAKKDLEESLLILSETDSLTSISNRRSGEQKVKKEIAEGKYGLFCLFDVNKFKHVNDSFGHSAGDKVLIEIANCMKKAFRTTDILIRLGGDEFVVFAPDITDKKIGKAVLDRFMKNIDDIEISELKGHKISISLGAVLINDSETFEQMYTKADSLMYDCKEEGGNVYKFY